MIQIKSPKDFNRLKRLALTSQGLIQAEPFGKGLAGARKAINHLGYIQIDSISVVERAHHHVVSSRIPGYKPEMLQALLLKKDIFEYWSHAAAFLPINDFRFSLPYKHAIKSGQTHWYKQPDNKLMAEILSRVRIDGPLRARDIEAPRSSKHSGWWDWKPAKKALEQLYMQGDLMVCSREGFQKTYDLRDRALPSKINTSMPSIHDLAEHLFQQQLRCHGLISLKGVSYLRKQSGLRPAIKALVHEGVAQGQLEQVQLPTGEVFIMQAGGLDQPLSRLSNRLVILSPFDNSVIQRDRLNSLFDYNYQIECYVPEPKRQYGYFCLPLLYRGEFVGRMDCKAHRKIGQLELKSLHWQEHNFERAKVEVALAKSVSEFCKFQQCQSVLLSGSAGKRSNPELSRVLTDNGLIDQL